MNLTDAIFHDDEAARLHLEAQRWPNGPYCPHCGEVEAVTRLAGKSTKPGTCICRSCRTKFTVTVGTIFERSHVGLAKWMLAFRLMASSKKGVAALQLERSLDVTYKTAWFMAHRIREAMTETAPGPLGAHNKVVEADETYKGGKGKNKHAHKRLPGSQGGANKLAVVSLVEREGKVRSFHVANVTAKTLRPILVEVASVKSYLMTDQSTVYGPIGPKFAGHGAVAPSPGLANKSEDFPEPWRTANDYVAWHGVDAERQLLRLAASLTAEGDELGAKRLFEVFLAIGEIQRLARRRSERLH